MPSPGMSANALCARLSADSGPCVSLNAFTERAPQKFQPPFAERADQETQLAEVTTPCKRNSCAPGTVCLVNRGCRIGSSCKPYRCVPGCKAGEVSHYLLTEDAYARVPTFNGQKGCAKVCLCTKRGIEKCTQVSCLQMQSCWLASKQIGMPTIIITINITKSS